MHPLSQGLREYAEIQSIYKNIHDMVGISQVRRVKILTRLRYGSNIEVSPRWPLINYFN